MRVQGRLCLYFDSNDERRHSISESLIKKWWKPQRLEREAWAQPRGLVQAPILDEWVAAAWEGRGGHRCSEATESEYDRVMQMRDKLTLEEFRTRERDAFMKNEAAKTYGEITVEGFRGVARRIDLCQDDIFYDLGSGVGKSVAQAWLEFGVLRSVGVELDKARHEAAQLAMSEIMTRYQRQQDSEAKDAGINGSEYMVGADNCNEQQRVTCADTSVFCEGGVKLMRRDLLEIDLSEATVVWCCNVCFSPRIDAQLALLLSQQPKLRALAVPKDFADGVPGFEHNCSATFEMSWVADDVRGRGRGTAVHFYTRAPPHSPC